MVRNVSKRATGVFIDRMFAPYGNIVEITVINRQNLIHYYF